MRAHGIGATAEGIAIERRLGRALAQPPCGTLRAKPGLPRHGGKRAVMGKLHIRCHGGKAKARPQPWRDQCRIFHGDQPRRHGKRVQIDISCRVTVRAGVEAQKPDVIGQHHGGFRPAQTGAMRLRICDPVCPRFIRVRIAVMLVDQHQRCMVPLDSTGRRLHRLFQIGHDHVDARGKSLGLPGSQIMRQPVDIGIAAGLVQQGGNRNRADPHHRGVREITERFQMVGALRRIGRNVSFGTIDQTVADCVQHCLIFAHRIDNALRRMRPLKGQRGHRLHGRQIRQVMPPRQPLQRIGTQMHGPVTIREKTQPHPSPLFVPLGSQGQCGGGVKGPSRPSSTIMCWRAC